MVKIRKAVIPVAGLGTRLLPVTKVVPKELIPIGKRPAIQYVVEEAVASGAEEVIFVCHPSKMAIVDYFKPDRELRGFLERKGKRKELDELLRIETLAKFRVVYQKEPLGLGHAVLCAREAVGDEPFLVMLPDMLVFHKISGSRQLTEACGEKEWGILLERLPKEKVSFYGIVKAEKVSKGVYRVEGAVEKPKPNEAPSDLAILGRYLFTPEIFKIIEGSKGGALGEIQLTDAIDFLARKNPGRGIVCEGKIFDVGTFEGLREVSAHSGMVI